MRNQKLTPDPGPEVTKVTLALVLLLLPKLAPVRCSCHLETSAHPSPLHSKGAQALFGTLNPPTWVLDE